MVLAFLLALTCGLPLLGSAQTLLLDPAVRTGKLANGFTYYIRKNTEPEKRVVMYLANKVGSVLETDEQRGLAHFMEHMSFNGTTHFPKNELINYLQKSGVRFGADINAYTSFDETVYQLPLPSDNPELLKNGIQIMRDWAGEATLETTEIDQERGVIMEEKRLRKGAGERIQEKTLPVLLNQSRYASRLPIGVDNVLLHFKPEVIRSFYKDWYRPDLQALIVVGDIDVDQIEQAIKAKFSDLKNPAKEKQRTKYEVPLSGKNQFLAVTDPEVSSTSLQVLIKRKSTDLKSVADYRNALVRGLFGQMMGGRYAELARQSNPPYINGGAGISSIMGGIEAFSVSVTAKPGELENGFKAVWREMRRAQQFGFTQTELDRAKKNYISSMEAALKEKDKVQSSSYVKEYLDYFLNDNAAPGIEKENELVNNLLPGIKLDEIDKLISTYVKETDRDIIVQAPEKDKATLPDEAKVLGWIKGVDAETLTAYKDNVSDLPLLKAAPVPGKIVKEEKDAKLGTTTLTLSNGIKVVLKKTDFQNNQIVFNAFADGGTSLYSDADFQSAVNAAGVVATGGIGNYNSLQLGKLLTGKQVSVSPYIYERSQGFKGSATPQDLPTALELVYGFFTEPRIDTALFKGQIAKAKASLANKGSSPDEVFGDTVKAVLSNYNVRRTAQSIEKIDQISLDRAFEIYKDRFADASALTFTFVGSIDEEAIKPLLEKYIASLPGKGRKEEAKDLGIHIPEGQISKAVYKGTEDKSTVLLVLSGKYDYGYEENLKMDALKECLEIRLLERLREEESGVYSPSAQVSVSKYPDSRFSLVISFGCAPANVEKLIASALDEVKKLGTTGPALENINKYKAEEKVGRETALKTNGYWLNYLVGNMLEHESLDQVFQFDAAMDKVTVDSLKATAAKYFTGQNVVRLVLLPENKK
ncbi:zinc protease [bacterium A37T11]|nr:zinc protease [bacterium A37T11]